MLAPLPKSRFDIPPFSLFLNSLSPYKLLVMQAMKNMLNNVASETAEQRSLKPGDDLSLYLRVRGTVDYVEEVRLQTVIS